VVKILLDAGAEKEAVTTAVGCTSLYLAAQCGHFDVVKILLDAGADKDAKTAEGKTSLDIASQEGHAEVAKAIAEQSYPAGAQPILR